MPESLFKGGRSLTAANQEFVVDVRGYAGTVVQLSGTWAATISFFASLDGTNYTAILATKTNSSTPATTTTTTGLYALATAGVSYLKITCSAYTSGTVWVDVASDISAAGLSGVSSGGGAVTIADGADVTQGAIADAAVTGDNSGTVNAHLRGLTKILADVWDSVNGWLQVSIQNTSVPVAPAPAASETLSNVAASATVVTLLASNASRKGAVFFNDSTSSAYLKFGAAASTTSFTYKIFSYQTVELPTPMYQGQITGIWDSATGTMRITEAT